jgi:uncharacterized protein
MTVPICIYHGPGCMDGLAAAWVVWDYHNGKIDMHPAQYGDTPPDVAGRDVFIVDFSYKLAVLEEMAQVARTITVIDHHKSAQADLEGGVSAANVDTVFAMDKSGAVLTWEYFQDDIPVPDLLLHIQDRDLWRFELEGTREIHAALVAQGVGYKEIGLFVKRGERALSIAKDDGSAILLAHNQAIENALDAGAGKIRIGGFTVMGANLPYAWASDGGHKLLERYPSIPFAASFVMVRPNGGRDGVFKFSLRSEDSRMDVSEVAKQYGGGGHRNAAGFTIASLEDLAL